MKCSLLLLPLCLLAASSALAQDPTQDPSVQKGVADWQRYHAPYLDELKDLSGSQAPGAQAEFLKLRGELMRSVAGPLFSSAGLEMPDTNDPMAAQLMLKSLLSKVADATQGGLPPGAGLAPPAGGAPGMGAGSGAPMDLGALQKLLGGGGAPASQGSQGLLQIEGADGILRKYQDDQEFLLELE